MFTNWLSLLTVSVLLSSSYLTMRNQSQWHQRRDLSLYDKAGPYVIPLDLNSQSRDKIQADVREFLWNHWRQRRLGHVMVTQYSKEGEPSTSSYFVEPDEKNVWQIAVKIDRTLVDLGDSKSQHHESVEYGAYSVERIEVPRDGFTQTAVIPEGERRSPQSYRLVLKDENGKSLTEI